MSFRDFRYPDVCQQLGLELQEARLYVGIEPLALDAGFLNRLREDTSLALAMNTEKARSEFIIAPILGELRRMNPRQFSLFSGIELNVDPLRGLNGVCDFVLSRSLLQTVLVAPIVAITEAKNDSIASGLGQGIAAMVAARDFNTTHPAMVHGVITTGSQWRFLQLQDKILTVDFDEYGIQDVARIMHILKRVISD
jgi:hypothetical protein